MKSQFFPRIVMCVVLSLTFISLSHSSLVVHPTELRDTVSNRQVQSITLHITNVGPASILSYTLSSNASWLSVTPVSGEINKGDTTQLLISFYTSNLSTGTYIATITIGDPHHGPITVPVTLVVTSLTGIDDEKGKNTASSYSLEQNFPNPFNPSTTIRYSIPTTESVRLTIFNLFGEEVATLVNEKQSGGFHEFVWNPKSNSSGVYYFRLQTKTFTATRKMIFSK